MILEHFTDKLNSAFPNVKQYVNHTDHNRDLPSFSITTSVPGLVREFQGRYWLDFLFTATYIPKDEYVDEWRLTDIQTKLAFCLEKIPLDKGYLKANNVSATRTRDRLVQGIASYSIYVKEPEKLDELMKELSQSSTTSDKGWNERPYSPTQIPNPQQDYKLEEWKNAEKNREQRTRIRKQNAIGGKK